MFKNRLYNKALSFLISILLISLILFTFIKPATGVYLNPGEPDDASVIENADITFEDVTLTIRGSEKIPIIYLKFSIFNYNTNQEIAYVKFFVDGEKISESPSETFSVEWKNSFSNGYYDYGNRWGYDENEGTVYDFGDGYGYGYGNPSYTDISFLYDITYSTTKVGKFYAKLYVESDIHTFTSDQGISFIVTSQPLPSNIYVDINNIEGPWDGSEGSPFNKIQDGVNAVEPGGTVIVSKGKYIENIEITKSLNLIGSGAENTIVEYSDYGHVFLITANDVKISGFTVKKADSAGKAGICLQGVENCNISNNNLTSNYNGILARNSNTNIIKRNNIFSNSEYGIYLRLSNENILENNNVFSNTDVGINLEKSNKNILLNNDVSSNNNYGIYFYESSNNMVKENNIFLNDDDGFSLDSSNNNTIKENFITDNDNNGVNLENSFDNIIDSNLISENFNNGIIFEGGASNLLTKNNISTNYEDGIYFLGSSANTFIDNYISSNNKKGINFRFSSENELTDNRIISNKEFGIYMHLSDNNLIYNNYFNNLINAWDDDNNQWNVWETLGINIIGGPFIGGNYWHDYDGVDLDGDGLGNTMIPYNSQGKIINGGDSNPLTITYINNPPNKPNRPSGPTKGKEGRSYQYYSVASDPDGDELSYLFDWGDGTNSGWTTPLFSGQTVIISHTWDHKGTFNIRVKAKDKYNFESEWSESLSVSMPKIRNKLHMLFFEILNRLFERFPFLEKIVKSLQCLNDIFSTIFNQFGGEA